MFLWFRSVHEPVSTSLKPRNRPRAGGVTPANNTPAAPPSSAESSTLLQQAQAYRYNTAPPQQNVAPAAHQGDKTPGNNPAYLNPFGERPSRDPSPVGKRFVEREFTHTRSRSDPSFVRNNANMMANQNRAPVNVVQHTPQQQNIVYNTSQQQVNASQVTYQREVEPTPIFPKWNPFSNDFVLNTVTTDDDFASLREPTLHHSQQSSARFVEPAMQHEQPRFVEPTVQHGQRTPGQAFPPQFVSGNVQAQYAQQPPNNLLSTQRMSSNSNTSPYASDSSHRSSDDENGVIMARPIVRSNPNDYFGGSRKNDAFVDGPVNAGCDVDEMTTSFNRNTTLDEPYRAQSEHANDIAGVFDSAPFRKPAKATPVVKTTPAQPVSPARDPFGAVPFKQKEAAKLARRQARKGTKEQTSGEARRVLPNIPTQARR